jgi:hypothetical protein
MERSRVILGRDRSHLLFLILQGPILAVLMLLAFLGHNATRFGSLDLFAGTFHAIEQSKESNRIVAAQGFQKTNWARFKGAAQTNEIQWRRLDPSKPALLIEGHARHRATVLFVLAFAVLWMATVAGAKEIAQDLGVIIHEELLGIGLGPVVASRFLVLWAISCWQAIPLVAVAGWILEEQMGRWFWPAYVSMVQLGGVATASGLLISAFSSSQRVALTIVPFVTVPQVLFAGVLQSFPVGHQALQYLTLFLPLRMGWEGLMDRESLWSTNVVQFRWLGLDPINQAVDVLNDSYRMEVFGWRDLYFNNIHWDGNSRLMMLVLCLTLLTGLLFRLRWRVRRGLHL